MFVCVIVCGVCVHVILCVCVLDVCMFCVCVCVGCVWDVCVGCVFVCGVCLCLCVWGVCVCLCVGCVCLCVCLCVGRCVFLCGVCVGGVFALFCLILKGLLQFSYIPASSFAISYFEDLLSVEIKEDWIIASVRS